jgi:hypothetical protein
MYATAREASPIVHIRPAEASSKQAIKQPAAASKQVGCPQRARARGHVQYGTVARRIVLGILTTMPCHFHTALAPVPPPSAVQYSAVRIVRRVLCALLALEPDRCAAALPARTAGSPGLHCLDSSRATPTVRPRSEALSWGEMGAARYCTVILQHTVDRTVHPVPYIERGEKPPTRAETTTWTCLSNAAAVVSRNNSRHPLIWNRESVSEETDHVGTD